jgi:hypothetical protein
MSNLIVNTIQNTSSVNAITIDTSGRVLYPQNPAFCARNCSNITGTGSVRVILFTTIDLNVGSNYNSGTGRFTAPVAGIYYFTYHLFGDGATQRHLSQLFLNGTTYYESTVETTAGVGAGYSNLEGHILVFLNANDFVDIRATVKVLGINDSYACFTGYLVGS